MAKLRIIGKFEKDCVNVGYLVMNSSGKDVKISTSKLNEMIEKGAVEGCRLINDGKGNTYHVIDAEILKNIESITDKRKITSRVVKSNQSKDIIGYKVSGSNDIIGLNKIWEMTFNDMIENAEVKVIEGIDKKKILIISDEISTEVMDY